MVHLPPGMSSSLNLVAVSNLVYGFKNVRWTSPVGPLRCFAIKKFTGMPSFYYAPAPS
jgi:hypothetical protein